MTTDEDATVPPRADRLNVSSPLIFAVPLVWIFGWPSLALVMRNLTMGYPLLPSLLVFLASVGAAAVSYRQARTALLATGIGLLWSLGVPCVLIASMYVIGALRAGAWATLSGAWGAPYRMVELGMVLALMLSPLALLAAVISLGRSIRRGRTGSIPSQSATVPQARSVWRRLTQPLPDWTLAIAMAGIGIGFLFWLSLVVAEWVD